MTPDGLLDELQRMLQARRYRAMVDLTVRVLPDVRPQMTPDHAVRLHELMHFADTAADLEELDSVRHDGETAARALPTA
jgi:hypothetical protein